jgi:hypothetical protein
MNITRPDDAAYQDNVLMAEVAEVNTMLGRYVIRFLDADAGRVAPLSTSDERALADQVTAVAAGLRARAVRRERQGDPPPLVVHVAPTVD